MLSLAHGDSRFRELVSFIVSGATVAQRMHDLSQFTFQNTLPTLGFDLLIWLFWQLYTESIFVHFIHATRTLSRTRVWLLHEKNLFAPSFVSVLETSSAPLFVRRGAFVNSLMFSESRKVRVTLSITAASSKERFRHKSSSL